MLKLYNLSNFNYFGVHLLFKKNPSIPQKFPLISGLVRPPRVDLANKCIRQDKSGGLNYQNVAWASNKSNRNFTSKAHFQSPLFTIKFNSTTIN